jgi:uncharacterized membrane protein HdeD (DUF308 family)
MAEQWSERLGGIGPPPTAGLERSVWAAELGPAELRRARRWLIVAGILALIGGVAAIAVPAIASVTIAIFIGWVLVFTGVSIAIDAFAVRGRPRWLRLAEAVLGLVAGLCIVIFPLTGTLTLTFFLAAWFFATGVLLLVGTFQQRTRPGVWLMGINGALSLILGILIVAGLPSSADWAIGLLVGINLLFWGIRALVAASLLKRFAG